MQDIQKEYTIEEVSQHNSEKDIWVILNNKVYDLTKFLKIHPGGKGVLLPFAGKDCTKQFYALHQEQVLEKFGPKLILGKIKNSKEIILQNRNEFSLSPYSEPNAYIKGFSSPYYKESHIKFKLVLRKYINEKFIPFADEWEEAGQFPTAEIYKQMGQSGLLACQIYPGDHLKYVDQLPGGLQKHEFDYFHELIAHQEMVRISAPGVLDSLKAGFVIGLPPVLKFAQKELKEQVAKDVLSGQKRICLAITDPDAGSDVSSLTCVAKKSQCGQFYIVNGTKKWITNGMFCDYFVTAVRTGDEGIFGVSMLLIERSEGVQTKQIKTSYSTAAGTAYITFQNVKVPVQNLLGEENLGFQIIMSNFNHERWVIAVSMAAGIRQIIDQCFRWGNQREVFGKKLIEQPVIRNKLAHMVAQLESLDHWIESLTYQMITMDEKKQFKYLGGQLALLKLQSTRTACFVSDNACQIFGGRAITRTGMGMHVERFQKTFKFCSIYGGSEEIMADLGIKQAIRSFPPQAKL